MAQLVESDADAPPGGVRVHASLPDPDRRSRLAGLVSLVLHLLIIYIALRLTAVAVLPEHSKIGDAIQLALGGGGGGGGQSGAAMQHAAPVRTVPPPPVIPPPPPPVPTVIPPPPAVTEPPPAVSPAPVSAGTAAAAGTGTGTGGGDGSGTGTGRGSGEGPGSGSGKGGGNGGGNAGFPPVNRQLVVPPIDGVPKELRGKTVDVTFTVSAAGVVTEVKVEPPIANKGYARKFDEVMRGYTFTAARDSTGKKVAGVATISVSFGTR